MILLRNTPAEFLITVRIPTRSRIRLIMTTAMMPMMIFLKTITIILTAVTVIQDILPPMETTSLSTRNQTPEQGTIIFKGFLSPRRFLQSFL